MKGAAAKTTWPRAPRSRAPLTHRAIEAPEPAPQWPARRGSVGARCRPRLRWLARPRMTLTLPATAPLGESDLLRAELVDAGSDAVVYPPAHTRPDDEQAPTSNATPGCLTSRTPATPMRPAASTSRRPRCSRNTSAAIVRVATSSKFNRSDPVAAGMRARPATRSTGPSAPPHTTAVARGRRPARMPRRSG